MPTGTDPTAEEALSYAWAGIRADPGTLLGAGFICMGITLLPSVLGQGLLFVPQISADPRVPGHLLDMTWFVAMGAVQLVMLVATAFVTAGGFNLALKVVRGAPYAISDLFGCVAILPSLLWLQVLQLLATALGLICFIVPGLVLALGLAISLPIAIDRNLGAIDAMKESWRVTHGHKGTIGTILGMCALFGLFGICTCGLASVVLLPLSQLALVYTYLRLTGQKVSPIARAV